MSDHEQIHEMENIKICCSTTNMNFTKRINCVDDKSEMCICDALDIPQRRYLMVDDSN